MMANDQEAMSRSLTQESFMAIRELLSPSDAPAIVDKLGDMDGTSLGNLQIVDHDRAKQVESLIQETAVIQIGPVAIKAPQLFALIRPFFSRPHAYSVIGSLSLNTGATPHGRRGCAASLDLAQSPPPQTLGGFLVRKGREEASRP